MTNEEKQSINDRMSKLYQEINDVKTDSNLSSEEKMMYINIYSSELESLKSDTIIDSKLSEIEKIREDIIATIKKIMNDSGNKELLSTELYLLCNEFSKTPFMFITDKENVYSKIDPELENKFQLLSKMLLELNMIIDRKYMKQEEYLHDYLSPEVFEFYSENGDFKPSEELDKLFPSELKKIQELDITSDIKGILKRSLVDITKHRTSYGLNQTKFQNLENVYNEFINSSETR